MLEDVKNWIENMPSTGDRIDPYRVGELWRVEDILLPSFPGGKGTIRLARGWSRMKGAEIIEDRTGKWGPEKAPAGWSKGRDFSRTAESVESFIGSQAEKGRRFAWKIQESPWGEKYATAYIAKFDPITEGVSWSPDASRWKK